MMAEKINTLLIFSYGSKNVRTYDDDGDIWFVAKDVAEALEYSYWQPNLISNVPDEWKGIKQINTPGGKQDVLCISEQGLYFFIGRSDKPKALPFQKWLAREVLPSIRRTGAYISEQALTNPEFVSGLLEKLTKLQEENESLRKNIEVNRAHTALGSIVYAMSGAVTVQDAANFLRQHGIPIGQNKLYKHLRDKKLLCARKGNQWNKPTSKGMEQNFFNLEVTSYRGKIDVTVKVTPKLLSKLADDFTQEYLPIVFMFDQLD